MVHNLEESLKYRTNKNDLLLKGIAASPGIMIGKTFLYDTNEIEVSAILLNTEAEIIQEIKGLKQALIKSKQQLLKLKKKNYPSIISTQVECHHIPLPYLPVLVVEAGVLHEFKI